MFSLVGNGQICFRTVFGRFGFQALQNKHYQVLICLLLLIVSPDGLLLQSSTVADSTSFNFADGVTESVPCSYIEFAERLVLPQFKNLANDEVWISFSQQSLFLHS